MNAQSEEIFRQARAAANTVSRPDYPALALHYADEMSRLASRGKVTQIIGNFAPSLLNPAERWSLLPEASRQILTNYQAAGGGSYVPNVKGNSQ